MKYLVNGKVYSNIEEATAAEASLTKKQSQQKKRKEEVDRLFHKYCEASDAYTTAAEAYHKDYGTDTSDLFDGLFF